VSRLETRRRRKIEALREKAKKDDINTSILAEAARLEREYPNQVVVTAHFEDFFEQRLKKYDVDLEGLKSEAEEQDRLLALLESANASFVAARKGDTSSREREQALQKLENAYFQYKEIVSNLEVGRKFYNDLAKIVGRFRDGCKTFAYERREEAMNLENDFITSLSSLSIHQQQPQQYQTPRSYNTRSSHAPPPQQPEIPAPVPTRTSMAPMQSPPIMPSMWNPEMGIKFGGDPNTNPQPNNQNQNKTWDPNAGFKFG